MRELSIFRSYRALRLRTYLVDAPAPTPAGTYNSRSVEMTDQSLKQTVLDELAWEPSVSEAHIGVTARGGVVTLTGHVGSYAEKCAPGE
jgi:osmotically-inducible protein OsmY